jgi:DNA-binding beta-propeller fold protein YncE
VIVGALGGLRVGVDERGRQPGQRVEQGVLGGDGDLVALDGGVGGVDDDLAFGPELVADPAQTDLPDAQHAGHGDGNARLLTLDLVTWQVTSTSQVGDRPDVLAYDPAAGRLYVAAESGDLTVLDNHSGHLTVTGRAYLAANAHVVAVNPATHDSYYPIPAGPGGHPALLTYQPAP